MQVGMKSYTTDILISIITIDPLLSLEWFSVLAFTAAEVHQPGMYKHLLSLQQSVYFSFNFI